MTQPTKEVLTPSGEIMFSFPKPAVGIPLTDVEVGLLWLVDYKDRQSTLEEYRRRNIKMEMSHD